MTSTISIIDAIHALPTNEQRKIAETILDELEVQGLSDSFELTSGHKRELDRRLIDVDANPDDEVSWDVLKAEMLEEFRKCPTN